MPKKLTQKKLLVDLKRNILNMTSQKSAYTGSSKKRVSENKKNFYAFK